MSLYVRTYTLGDSPEPGAELFRESTQLPPQFATQREFWQRVAAVEYAQLIERISKQEKTA